MSQMSAAAFAKGLLDLEGPLTPILVVTHGLHYRLASTADELLLFILDNEYFDHLKVSLVSKDSSMLDGLDTASIEMEEAKVFRK